jgi:hypothetical protein
MRAIAVCTLAVLAALAAEVEPARACSCVPPDPWAAVALGDAAFVGTVLERRDSRTATVLVLSVERRLKGPLGTRVEVRTTSSAMCGVDADVGKRVGLALDRYEGKWRGSLCWQFEPAQLLVVTALPPPTGRGPEALFVGGRFGPARSLALDRRGRTLTYGIGGGRAQAFSTCPGGQRVAELVRAGSAGVVAVRELPGLRLLWQRRLRRVSVDAPHCLDRLGERVAVFASDEAADGRLVHVRPAGARTIWRGSAFYASFRGRIAYVQALRNGTTILAVDAWTGDARSLGSVRVDGAYQLVLNRVGTHLAGDSFTEGVGNPRLLVIDLRRRPLGLRTIALPTQFGSMRWLGNDRPVYFGGRGEILVYDAQLRLLSRSSRWRGGAPAVVGRRAFGIDRRGRLVAATLPRGTQRVVRTLPGTFRSDDYRVVAAARR